MDGVAPPLSRRARIARTVVVGVAGLGLCAAAMALGTDVRKEARPVAEPVLATTPLMIELRRCKALEERALADPDCRRVWAEQRRRFLGISDSAGAPG